MDWTDLHIFLNTVRAGSYSEASRRLSMTRTTVGRHIQRLEQQVGQTLFERTEDGHRPTTTGAIVLDAARRIEMIVDEAQEKIVHHGGGLGGTVRLASSSEIEVEFLSIFAAFKAENPNVMIELRGDRDSIASLSDRKSDLAICICRHRPGHLEGTFVGNISTALYGRASHSRDNLAAGDQQDATPDIPLPWVMPGKRIIGLADRWDNDGIAADRRGIEVNSWSALIAAVKQGLGAAYLWTFVADRDPGLARLAGQNVGTQAQLWVLHRADVPPDHSTTALMNFVAAHLRSLVETGE